MKPKIPFSFLFCIFSFLCAFPWVWAQDLDFYSRIDDEWYAVAHKLTKRHLDDFSTFRNFGKNCRSSAPWLDTAGIDQDLLEELLQGKTAKINQLVTTKKPHITQEELHSITTCLTESYTDMKNRAIKQQKTLEDVGSISVFMDGSLENSDFDIIDDINKINKIIFSEELKYQGTKNRSQKSLLDFLSGKAAPQLFDIEKTPKDPKNPKQSSQQEDLETIFHITWKTSWESENTTSENSLLPWDNVCSVESGSTTTNGNISVTNMLDENFSRDLRIALRGGSTHNTGNDYSQNTYKWNNSKNNQNNNPSNAGKNFLENMEDYATKLPCSDFFCITLGSNISRFDVLKWGKSHAIESILDKHIKTVKPLSWGSLAAQKMTNNSFQLPFLNIKFNSQVAGGAVFMHNTPQVTSTPKKTEQSEEEQFDTAMKCAFLDAGLNTDEKKNNGIIGGGFNLNPAHNTENVQNSIIPLSPLEMRSGINCDAAYQNAVTEASYKEFSTQVNEIYAFTRAMMDIINQTLDSEKRLDTIKQV